MLASSRRAGTQRRGGAAWRPQRGRRNKRQGLLRRVVSSAPDDVRTCQQLLPGPGAAGTGRPTVAISSPAAGGCSTTTSASADLAAQSGGAAMGLRRWALGWGCAPRLAVARADRYPLNRCSQHLRRRRRPRCSPQSGERPRRRRRSALPLGAAAPPHSASPTPRRPPTAAGCKRLLSCRRCRAAAMSSPAACWSRWGLGRLASRLMLGSAPAGAAQLEMCILFRMHELHPVPHRPRSCRSWRRWRWGWPTFLCSTRPPR